MWADTVVEGVVDVFAPQERDARTRKFVSTRTCRLVNAPGFPVSLAESVVSAGRGTYRVDLPPTRIRVFERGAGDAVRE